MVPTNGNDILIGTNGNDTIDALNGNDTIIPRLGNDIVNGGDGNDLLVVDYSSHTLSGLDSGIILNSAGSYNGFFFSYTGVGDSFDQINFTNIERFKITAAERGSNIASGNGNDTLLGGSGFDSLNGGGGNDYIDAGKSSDFLDGGTGNDYILAGEGDDVIDNNIGIDSIDGGAGIDILSNADFSKETKSLIIDDTGNTKINLTDGTKISNIEFFTNITTGSGNDLIDFSHRESNLNGTIKTGSGNDTINSGQGYDLVDGGEGNDLLIIDYSYNTYTGIEPPSGITRSIDGAGKEFFEAYDSNNTSTAVFFSNIERFQITGTSANDNIYTGNGNDTIDGGAGNDTIDGLGGNDYLTGGTGKDSLTGGSGADTLIGGAGADILVGGLGLDSLTGGAGADIFALSKNSGIDTIRDFGTGGDKLQISASDFGSGLVAGNLAANRFLSGSSVGAGSATGSVGQFLYNTNSGALYFDANGAGGGLGIQIATLATNPGLSTSDFSVVV
jgi:Ca2+-binding RTX toxin-like protein